jgi:hypothetical protein
MLLITSQRYRDQGRNTQDCLNKLAELLLSIAVAPDKTKSHSARRAVQNNVEAEG